MHLEENAQFNSVCIKTEFFGLKLYNMCLLPLFIMFYRQFSFIYIVPNSHLKVLYIRNGEIQNHKKKKPLLASTW